MYRELFTMYYTLEENTIYNIRTDKNVQREEEILHAQLITYGYISTV